MTLVPPRTAYYGNPATPGYEPNKQDLVDRLEWIIDRIAARESGGPMPDDFGAVSGILIDPATREVYDEIATDATVQAEYLWLLERTVRRFIRAGIWADVTYSVDTNGVVTWGHTTLSTREQAAYDYIEVGYLIAVDGAHGRGTTITEAMLDAGEAIDLSVNTTAMQDWLTHLGASGTVGLLKPADYPINATLLIPSNARFTGTRGRSRIQMAAGVGYNKPVAMTGDTGRQITGVEILGGVIFDFNTHLRTTAGSSTGDPASEDLQGTCLSIAYTSRALLDVECWDARKHVFDVAGSDHGRSGTPYTYPHVTERSTDIRVLSIVAEGGGDDLVTTHSCDRVYFDRVVSRFARGDLEANSNGFEVDDGSVDTTAVSVNCMFCYDAVEIKGHDDAEAAYNVTIQNLYAKYCTNGVIVRHVGHGAPLVPADPPDPEVPAQPQSPHGRHVRLGTVYIESPLVWPASAGDTRAGVRVYAYTDVECESLTAIQGDAAADYYGSNATESDGVLQTFRSAGTVRVGKLYVEGFSGSLAAARITSSTFGPVTIGEIVTKDGPLRILSHTGDEETAATVQVSRINGHRETATAGSIAVRNVLGKTFVSDLRHENFESTWLTPPDPPPVVSFSERPTQAQLDALDAETLYVNWASATGGTVTLTRSDGATDIPDIDDWVPIAPVTTEHFGIVADLTYTDDSNGPVRTAGTDNHTAWVAMDTYCHANGLTAHVPPGQYYVASGLVGLRARWVSTLPYAATIWVKYSVYEAGVWLRNSDATFEGFKVIGQYDRAGTAKPANAGHFGSVLLAGQFLTGTAQTPMTGIKIDALVRRARDTAEQNSDASILCNGMGYVTVDWKLGVWGTGSNVASSALVQHHWGGLLDDGGAWTPSADPSAYDNLETYHPEDCTVEFQPGVIDAAANGISMLAIRSATINCHIGACKTTGLKQPIYDVPGDDTGRIAIAAQIGRVGMGNTIGFQSHVEVDAVNGESGSGSAASAAAAFFGWVGTSKWETAPGPVDQADQSPAQFTGAGMRIASTSGRSILRLSQPSPDAVFDPGPLHLIASGTDTDKAVFVQQCHAPGVHLNVQQANRAVHLRGATIGSLFLRNTMGTANGSGDAGDLKQGWNANNCGLLVETTTYSTTTTATLTAGDTTLTVDALPIDVHVGAEVYVNGNRPVRVTRYALVGCTELEIEPSPYGAASASTVLIVFRGGADRVILETQSSEYGCIVRGGKINSLDVSKMSGQGRGVLWLQYHDYVSAGVPTSGTSIGAEVTINGGTIPIVGRLASELATASVYTIQVQPMCLLNLNNVTIPNNPDNATILNLVRQSGAGPWGRASLNGCRIEDPSRLVTATVKSESISLTNCVDFDGAPVTISDV